jgi:hypothetical protein
MQVSEVEINEVMTEYIKKKCAHDAYRNMLWYMLQRKEITAEYYLKMSFPRDPESLDAEKAIQDSCQLSMFKIPENIKQEQIEWYLTKYHVSRPIAYRYEPVHGDPPNWVLERKAQQQKKITDGIDLCYKQKNPEVFSCLFADGIDYEKVTIVQYYVAIGMQDDDYKVKVACDAYSRQQDIQKIVEDKNLEEEEKKAKDLLREKNRLHELKIRQEKEAITRKRQEREAKKAKKKEASR